MSTTLAAPEARPLADAEFKDPGRSVIVGCGVFDRARFFDRDGRRMMVEAAAR